ncbi:serine hydrolase-like protein 2 isoform 2-T2 [Thomomys bottae]
MKLAMPWGHLAAKRWGAAEGPPVLCLHGLLDNANTFDKLIPQLPPDFHYVAIDFGGHGRSSHYSPGFLYCHYHFVIDVRRVVAALKWTHFSIVGHSFGGTVGGMFACIFPEMVDKLILLDTLPLLLDFQELDNLVTYKHQAIEHMLQIEASQKLPSVVSPPKMLQRFLEHRGLDKECGALLLKRGTTKVGSGLVLNRDPRLSMVKSCFNFVSKEQFVQFIGRLQASVLLIKAVQEDKGELITEEEKRFIMDMLRSKLQEVRRDRAFPSLCPGVPGLAALPHHPGLYTWGHEHCRILTCCRARPTLAPLVRCWPQGRSPPWEPGSTWH